MIRRRIKANDYLANSQYEYADNYIKTSKYTLLTFLPLNLFEQFRRLANTYFLCLLILQLIPQISSLTPITTAVPLIVVLAITGVKDAHDDICRHKSDNQVNNRLSELLKDGRLVREPWHKVKVGDIIRIENDQFVAADLMILSTSEPNGFCFVETAELDGETNLKCRQSLSETAALADDTAALSAFDGEIVCEPPNNNLTKFEGTLFWAGQKYPIDNDKMLLRGCILRNTKWCFGLVVFAGRDTKLMQNSGKTIFKRTKSDRLLNILIMGIVLALLTMCLFSSLACGIWEALTGRHFARFLPREPFIPSDGFTGATITAILTFFSYLIVLNTVVPISLYVSVEVIRYCQSLLIDFDQKMFYAKKDAYAKARTTTLNEELGQVEYVFSDKTGTLTQNLMTFNKCSINGRLYGEVKDFATGEMVDMSSENAHLFEPIDFGRHNPQYFEANFKFYDQTLLEQVQQQNREVHEFFTLLALCHTVMSEEKNGRLEYQAQSPDEAALSSAARNFGFVFKNRTSNTVEIEILGKPLVYELLAILDFNNVRKRMSVIVRGPDQKLTLYCKGADSVIFEHLGQGATPDRVRDITTDHLEHFAGVGLRTLCLAKKELSEEEYTRWQEEFHQAATSIEDREQKVDRCYELIEQDLQLLGATAIEDKLQDRVAQTIANLMAANIKVWVLTGDKQETAINIGYSCELLNDDMCEIFIVDGCYPEEVDKQLKRCQRQMSKMLAGQQLQVGRRSPRRQQAGSNNRRADSTKPRPVKGKRRAQSRAQVEPTYTWSSQSNFRTQLAGSQDLNNNNLNHSANSVFTINLPPSPQDETERQATPSRATPSRTPLGGGDPRGGFALVISGHSLAHALCPNREELFLQVSCQCKSVICCRVTPLQKALVVDLVKRHKKVITLSIGDGANDVSMLKMAHIGVGISGQEGMQAVLASDFSIAQFCYLERLLLVHGRWSYFRMCKFLRYFFYKNFSFTLCNLWYAFFCGFSAQTLFDPIFISFYNVFYTSLPVLALGIFDQDVNDRFATKYPLLYTPGHIDLLFNKYEFLKSVAQGIVTSFTTFFITYGAFMESVDSEGVNLDSHELFGCVVSTNLVVVVTAQAALDTSYWTVFNHIVIWGSVAFYFAITLIFNSRLIRVQYLGVFRKALSTPLFWFTLFLVLVILLVPVIAYRFYKLDLEPTLSDRCRFIQRLSRRRTKPVEPQLRRRSSTRKSRRSIRSGYAFSHQEGFGNLITSGMIIKSSASGPAGSMTLMVRRAPRVAPSACALEALAARPFAVQRRQQSQSIRACQSHQGARLADSTHIQTHSDKFIISPSEAAQMPARKGLLAPQNTFLQTIAQRFDGTHSNFVLGNAKFFHHSYPIVYCSDGFCELTGYSRAQVMQKSCACDFLYGQKTDVQHTEAIKGALQDKQELKLEVILYKRSGTPFWCLLDIVPIQNENHEVVLFLCSHKDITKQKLHEQAKRVQQQLQVAQNGAQQPGSQDGDDPSQNAKTSTSDQASSQQQDDSAQQTTKQLNQQQLQPFQLQSDLQRPQPLEAGGADKEFEPASSSDSDSDELAENDRDKHTISQYSRRRSRAVLYQLSGHYGQQRGVNMKSKLNLNTPMNLPEYKTTTIEKRRFILSHYGVYKTCWDWLILMVSFYVAIVVPYNATFRFKKQESDEAACQIDAIDIMVEVVFVIDVVLNFRTTFVNRKGEVVTMPKTICKHYVQGWFVVDFCAALPFDLLCPLNLFGGARLDLNLLKLIRLLRLARLLQKMDRYSQYSYIILTLLMLIFSLLAHWAACVWYAIAMKEIDRNKELKIGWLHQLSDKLGYNVLNGNTTDIASAYVTALYFTTSSLTSVGFGNVSANTNAEKIFSIVIMLIGALMHALVFGNVTALIRVMYARRSNYQTRLRDLKDFFRLHQLPKHLTQRMNDYFQTTWSLNHGIDTSEILHDFPEELRGDVSMYLHREVLSLPIFQSAPTGFLKSLAKHIESKFCCPTEYLIHRGDALNYLYLVCNGSMEILQDNMVVAILSKDDLVGYDVNAPSDQEPRLAGLVKSSSDLKALTYCDLKCINIHGLLEVLKLYPEFSDIFHNEIIHDLSFNLRETHDGDSDDNQSDGNPGRPDKEVAMQRVCRSITAGEHQIGRYDDREDTADDEDRTLDEDRTQDEEDEDEEEEDDGDASSADSDDHDSQRDDDKGPPGGGGELVEKSAGSEPSAGCESGSTTEPMEASGPLAKTAAKSGNGHDSSSVAKRLRRRRSQQEADSQSFDGLAPALRSAIGRQNPPQSKGPISFDLSKNTTAIVDRRRRSAGCIALQPGSLATGLSRRQAAGQSSSLIHISEDQALPESGRRPHPKASTRADSRQEYLQLAGQLVALNESLASLRQEFRRELKEFRSSMQMLVHSSATQKTPVRRLLRSHSNLALTMQRPGARPDHHQSADLGASSCGHNEQASSACSRRTSACHSRPFIREAMRADQESQRIISIKSSLAPKSTSTGEEGGGAQSEATHKESAGANQQLSIGSGGAKNRVQAGLAWSASFQEAPIWSETIATSGSRQVANGQPAARRLIVQSNSLCSHLLANSCQPTAAAAAQQSGRPAKMLIKTKAENGPSELAGQQQQKKRDSQDQQQYTIDINIEPKSRSSIV